MTKLLTYLTALLIFLRLVLAEQPHKCNTGDYWIDEAFAKALNR